MASVLACSGPGAASNDDTVPALTDDPAGCDSAARVEAERLRDEGYLGRALIAATAAQDACASDVTAALIVSIGARLGVGATPVTPSDDDIAAALSHYRQGVQLRRDKKYTEAIAALDRAFELAPHPLTLIQLGLTHDAAGDAVGKRTAFARALALAERAQGAVAVPAVREEHASVPAVIAFSPDLSLMVTADAYAVIVWDVATARQIRTLPGGRLGIMSAAFSPDGGTLAIGTTRGMLLLVDTATWETREEHIHADGVRSLAFSPDGSRVLTGGGDYRIAVHEVDSLSMVFGVYVDVLVQRVAYSEDGTKVAVGGGGLIAVRSAEGDFVRKIDVGDEFVREYAFSADLSVAVSAHRGWPVRIWNALTGELRAEIDIEGLDVAEVELAGGGDTLFVGDMSGTISRFAAATGEQLDPVGSHPDAVLSMAISPSGVILGATSSDSTIRLWDTETRKVVRDLSRQRGGVNTVRVTSDGRAIVSGDQLGTMHVWDLTAAGGHGAYPVMKRITRLDLDPDGKRAAVGGEGVEVVVLDVDGGAERVRLQLDGGSATAVAFGTDGVRIAAASSHGQLRVWDVASGAQLGEVAVSARGFVDIAPDLARYASAYQWWARVYSTGTGELLHELENEGSVYGMGFSADGTAFITTTGKGNVHLWNLATGEELRAFDIEVRERIEDAAFSPDGTVVALASADESLQLYDLQADALRFKVVHDNDVNEVAFTPDGRTVVTACQDKTVRLWDVESGAPLAQLTATDGEWLAIATDGRIDGNDTPDGGPSFLYWQVGDLQLPGYVGWQRQHHEGLLADLMSRAP